MAPYILHSAVLSCYSFNLFIHWQKGGKLNSTKFAGVYPKINEDLYMDSGLFLSVYICMHPLLLK